MANYSLVVNSKFTPTDYASQLVPIFSDYGTRWNTEFDKAQKDYLENLELKSLVANEGDTELSEIYGSYEKALNDFYDAFSRGYDSSVEAKGLAANRKYKEVITPIEREFIKREKKIAEQDAKRAEDGSYIFDYDYRDAKISDMMKNPNRTYNAIKGSAVQAETSRAIQQLAKAYSSLDGANIDKDDTTSQYILTKKRQGYTLQAILNGIEDDPSAPSELKELKKSIRGRYDYGKLSPENQTQFDYYVDLGYYDGIGQVEKDYISNRNYISKMVQDTYDFNTGNTKKDKGKDKDKKDLRDYITKSTAEKEGWDIQIKGSEETGDRVYIAKKGNNVIVESDYDSFTSKLSTKDSVEGLEKNIMTDIGNEYLAGFNVSRDIEGALQYKNILNFDALDKKDKKYIGRTSQSFKSDARFDTPIYDDPSSYGSDGIKGAKVITGSDLDSPEVKGIIDEILKTNPQIISKIIKGDVYRYLAEKGALDLYNAGSIDNIEDYKNTYNAFLQNYTEEGEEDVELLLNALKSNQFKLVKIPSRNRDGYGDYFLIKQ